MKKSSQFSILTATLLARFMSANPTPAWANAECIDLGYHLQTSTDPCKEGDMIKCPKEKTYVFCKTAGCQTVNVGEYQLCEEYCIANDSNSGCKKAKDATCDEWITKKKNGVRVPAYYSAVYDSEPPANIHGDFSKDLYVFGKVLAGPDYLNPTKFLIPLDVYDAWDFEICREGHEKAKGTELAKKEGFFESRSGYFTAYGYTAFYIKTKLDELVYAPTNSNYGHYWSMGFYKEADIRVKHQSPGDNNSYVLSLDFHKGVNNLAVRCEETKPLQTKCYVSTSADESASLTYCLSGEKDAYSFSCHGNCTTDNRYCYY